MLIRIILKETPEGQGRGTIAPPSTTAKPLQDGLSPTEYSWALESLRALEPDLGCSATHAYPLISIFFCEDRARIVRNVTRKRHPALFASMLWIASFTACPGGVTASLYELTLLSLPRTGPLCHDEFVAYIHVGVCSQSALMTGKARSLAMEFKESTVFSTDPVEIEERRRALLLIKMWEETGALFTWPVSGGRGRDFTMDLDAEDVAVNTGYTGSSFYRNLS